MQQTPLFTKIWLQNWVYTLIRQAPIVSNWVMERRRATWTNVGVVKVKMGDYVCIIDALVFELGGVDLVLGVSWLATLGEVQVNWKTLTMQFTSPKAW